MKFITFVACCASICLLAAPSKALVGIQAKGFAVVTTDLDLAVCVDANLSGPLLDCLAQINLNADINAYILVNALLGLNVLADVGANVDLRAKVLPCLLHNSIGLNIGKLNLGTLLGIRVGK